MKKVIFFTNLMVASTLLGMQNDLFHATRHSDCRAMQGILSRDDINIDAQDEATQAQMRPNLHACLRALNSSYVALEMFNESKPIKARIEQIERGANN